MSNGLRNQPIVFEAMEGENRELLIHLDMIELHTGKRVDTYGHQAVEEWFRISEAWGIERYVQEVLALNPRWLSYGFYVDRKDPDNLRMRPVLRFSEIRALVAAAGYPEPTDEQIADRVAAPLAIRVRGTEVLRLVYDGEHEPCIVGDWSRITVDPAWFKRS